MVYRRLTQNGPDIGYRLIGYRGCGGDSEPGPMQSDRADSGRFTGFPGARLPIMLRRIAFNTATGAGARFASLGISFLTTPILVTHLGSEAFGTLAIIASLPAYIGLLDFGVGPGLVKHLTEQSEIGGQRGVRNVMTLSACFYGVLGVALLPAIWLLAPRAGVWLSHSREEQAAISTGILLMFGYFIGSGLAGVLSARLVSLHRMDITSTIGLISQAIYGVLVLALIPRSPTLLTAVWLNMVQLFVAGIALFAIVIRTDKTILSNPLKIPGSLARKLFAFGGWMQLNNLSALVNLEADKLIIAAFLNVAAVTPYQIGNRLASLNRIVPIQLLSAMMPAATIVQLGSNQRDAMDFYGRMSRYVMLITLLITGFLIVAADQLIVTWLGRPYPQAALIVLALSLSFAINNLTGGGTTMVRAAGEPRFETYYAVLSMVLNIGLTVLLAPRFGLAGILGGTVIANVIGSVFFIVLFHRRTRFPWYETMGDWLWRLLAATVMACLAVLAIQRLEPLGLAQERLVGVVLLMIYVCAYLSAFAVGLSLFKFWDLRDMRAARSVLTKFYMFKKRQPS
jgi:O-antigen/teichoic acid export membrane protein